MSADLLRPLNTLNPWQRIKVRQANGSYKPGYVITAHDHGLKLGLDNRPTIVPGQLGITVIAEQVRVRNTITGEMAVDTIFFQLPSTALVLLDE